MFSNPDLPEWPANTCPHCSEDKRTVGEKLHALNKKREAEEIQKKLQEGANAL